MAQVQTACDHGDGGFLCGDQCIGTKPFDQRRPRDNDTAGAAFSQKILDQAHVRRRFSSTNSQPGADLSSRLSLEGAESEDLLECRRVLISGHVPGSIMRDVIGTGTDLLCDESEHGIRDVLPRIDQASRPSEGAELQSKT